MINSCLRLALSRVFHYTAALPVACLMEGRMIVEVSQIVGLS